MWRPRPLVWLLALLLLQIVGGTDKSNRWVVLVDSSRFFFNYRHATNALVLYDVARRLGVPDSQILLLMADVPACSNRNPLPTTVHTHGDPRGPSVFDDEVEVDLRGPDVNVASFLALLTGRPLAAHGTPRNQRLDSDADSQVLVYMTGHGGQDFFKFHGVDELSSVALGAAVQEMSLRGRFKELLLIADTCQAETMANHVSAPNVFFLGSSLQGENSYAVGGDPAIGVSTIDRFSAAAASFFARTFASSPATPPRSASLHDLVRALRPAQLRSTPAVRVTPGTNRWALHQVPLLDFFGAELRPRLALPAPHGDHYTAEFEQENPCADRPEQGRPLDKPGTCPGSPRWAVDLPASLVAAMMVLSLLVGLAVAAADPGSWDSADCGVCPARAPIQALAASS